MTPATWGCVLLGALTVVSALVKRAMDVADTRKTAWANITAADWEEA